MSAMAEIERIFNSDSRIVYIIEYIKGFKPLRSRPPHRRLGIRYWFDGRIETIEYDARREFGRGRRWVAFSLNNGRLASGD